VRRCKKNCHQLHILGQQHTCTPDQKCPGFSSCLHLPYHPEEKKRHWEEEREERKRKRALKKEDESEVKRRKDDLLRVRKQKKYDGWWRPALERVVASNPETYSMEEGTKKRALAMICVTKAFTECRRKIRLQAEINRKIKGELKTKMLTAEEELAYISRRQAELQEGQDLDLDPDLIEDGASEGEGDDVEEEDD
jgi:hypothetical protein